MHVHAIMHYIIHILHACACYNALYCIYMHVHAIMCYIIIIIYFVAMQEKFFGTIVTKENFLEWRKKFDEEMRAKKSRDFNVETIGLTGA